MNGKYLFCVILFFFSGSSDAQIQKYSWQAGLSVAPLFELNSSGLNGKLFNLHGEYSFSNRFILGIQPYYACTNEKMIYAYDLIHEEPKEIQKDVFYSFGANVELKFILKDNIKFKPYSSVIFGVGHSRYHIYHNNVFGQLEPQDRGYFYNYNLGIGLGAYFFLNEKWYLDTKMMYTDVSASKDIESSSYLYPSVGIIKVF